MPRFKILNFDHLMPQCELDYTNYTGYKRREKCMMVMVQEDFGERKILQVWVPVSRVEGELNAYYKRHFPERYYDKLYCNNTEISDIMLVRFWYGEFKMSLTTCLNTPYYQVVTKLEKLQLQLVLPDDDEL